MVCLILFGASLGNKIIGVKNIVKSFPFNNKLQFPSESKSSSKYVLKNISIELGAITTFIGPSKSGKSTLAKCIVGMERVDQGELVLNVPNTIRTIAITDDVSSKLVTSCGYLDHLYSLSYDSNKSVGDIIAKYRNGNKLTESIINVINLPLNEKINSLLESQKILFELLLVLMQTSTTSSNDYNPVVVMDEYLDKVIPSVRSKFYKSLQALITQIPLSVIIITHSRSVLQEIAEKVVVIKVDIT